MFSCVCHQEGVSSAADSRSVSHSLARLSHFESQRREAKWKVTLGRRRDIKHSGSLSERNMLAAFG